LPALVDASPSAIADVAAAPATAGGDAEIDVTGILGVEDMAAAKGLKDPL
jgi:hypothetical protein